MKKIIGLALALAAAALVFVGCSDETGGGETDGNKWELTMTINGTANVPTAVEGGKKYRRFWKQLGTKNKVAGITTTITVDKDKYSTSKNNSGVVGLMFDYNDSAKDVYGEGDRKDFYLIGFNFKRRTSGTPEASYYIVRNEGVPYDKKESLDTNEDDLVSETNGAKGAMVTKGATALDTDSYLAAGAWETLKSKYFVDGTSKYKIVVSIRPSLGANGLPDEKGYDVYFGKTDGTFDKIFTCDLTALTNSGRVANKTEVTVGKTIYNLPCGGIAVYGNAKTINYQYGTNPVIHDNEGTKIVAIFDNKTAGKKTETKKVENVDALATGIIGNLQIASDYGDNIKVIVE